MKIDDDLNLVIPIVKDGEEVLVYGYHTPISRQVFEANFRVIAATKAAMSSKGGYYEASAGPRIAALALRDMGKRDAVERGDVDDEGEARDGGAEALLAEIKRLTTVLVPEGGGWQMVPVDAAIRAGRIDEEDWAEAESSIVFFTCHLRMAKKADRKQMAEAVSGLIGCELTSLPCLEWSASLSKSTPAAPTVARVVSSVPI